MILGAAILAVIACGDGGGQNGMTNPNADPPAPSTVAQFTVIPVIMPEGATLTPLGHIQPVGHVLPTDHVYFYSWNIDKPNGPDTLKRTVFAPGDGVVTWILFQDFAIKDYKVMFRMTTNFYYYLDHVLLDPNIKVGTIVRAGDRLGTTDPGAALDLGAFDMTQTLTGFLVPARYPDQTLHCVSPFKYFTEPLRSQLYAKIRRVPSAPDRDGKIDYDIAGRLVGSWFHETVPKTMETSGPNGWPKSLAFAYDFNDPSQVRVSIGGTIATPGVWAVPADAPRPENVSTSSGVVTYRLLHIFQQFQSGLMLVEMQAADRIRVQVFEGSQASTATFDSRAQIYVR